MDNGIIVDSIKKLCRDNNITVSQLEKETGMSQGLVSKWKDKIPSLDKIVDIADYFHVSIDEVVGYRRSFSENQTLKFINSIYEQTKTNELVWYVLDDNHPVKFDDVYVVNNDSYNSWEKEYYYCKYKYGYFLFEIYYLEIDFEITDSILNFYIQPDRDSKPVLQCEGESIL